MSRPIKFRGKRVDNSEWVYGDLAHCFDTYISDDKNLVDDISRGWVKVVDESVGQFTGLKDKNSKEIYEGDILQERLPKRSERGGHIAGEYEYRNTVVVGFKNGCFIDKWTEETLYEKIFSIASRKINHEVIDTIYNNPSLLEVQP